MTMYILAFKSFARYLADAEVLPNNPLQLIRQLNPEIER